MDYAAHDDLAVLAIAQVCAYRMDMHIQEHAVRSFSSTGGDRRKMLYLDFDSGRPEQEVVDVFRSELSRRNFQHVAIGCVGLFQLPRDSFILTYNSLDWIDDSCISELIDSVVLVSGFKAVIKLNLSSTVDELKLVLEAFAAKIPGGVRQLLDNSARQIWAERLHHRPKLTKDQKCRQTSQARAISLDSLLHILPTGPKVKRQKISLETCLLTKPTLPLQQLHKRDHSSMEGSSELGRVCLEPPESSSKASPRH